MRYITINGINNLITDTIAAGGEVRTIKEGVLGYGTMVFEAPGHKTVVVREQYKTAWQSVYTFRVYKKTPKKYDKARIK